MLDSTGTIKASVPQRSRAVSGDGDSLPEIMVSARLRFRRMALLAPEINAWWTPSALTNTSAPRAVQGIAAARQLLVPAAVGQCDRLREAPHPPVRRFDRLDRRTGLIDNPGRFLTFELCHPRPLLGLVMSHPDAIKAAQRILQPVRISLSAQVELCPPYSVTLGACIAKSGQEGQREPAFEADELSVDRAQDIAGRVDLRLGRPHGTMSLRSQRIRSLVGQLRSRGMIRLSRQLLHQALPPGEVSFQTLNLDHRAARNSSQDRCQDCRGRCQS